MKFLQRLPASEVERWVVVCCIKLAKRTNLWSGDFRLFRFANIAQLLLGIVVVAAAIRGLIWRRRRCGRRGLRRRTTDAAAFAGRSRL